MSDEIVKIDRPDPPAEILVSILKSAFGAVPVVGQALMEIVFDGRSRIKQERVNLFLKEIADEIRREKVDYKFIKSEEFSDLIEEIMINVAKTRTEYKRKHFKNILLDALMGKRQPDLSRNYLNILNLISDGELVLFKQLRNKWLELLPSMPSMWQLMEIDPDNSENDFRLTKSEYLQYLQSLIRNGLIQDSSFRPGTGPKVPYRLIAVTEMGDGFYEYIISNVSF